MNARTLFVHAGAGLLAAVLACGPAWALTMLTEENPPLNYTESGKLVGVSTAVVHEIGKRAKVPMTFESTAWDKAYLRAQAESVCLFSTARLDNREQLFRWVGPIGYQQWGVYGTAEFKTPVKKFQELTRYSIGVLKLDAKREYLMQRGVTDVRDVADDSLNPPKLLLPKSDPGHIDLWITGAYKAHEMAAKAGIRDLKLVWAITDVPTWLACNRGVPQGTVDTLQRAADSLTKDGTLGRLMKKYGTAPKR